MDWTCCFTGCHETLTPNANRTRPDIPSSSDLADRFRRFAVREADGVSPLYAALAPAIAEDGDLLDLAGTAPANQPTPNLLFAAVQFLLLREPGTEPGLAGHYASVQTPAGAPDAAFPAFRGFCLDRRPAIQALLRSRVVNTNEVRRCALLLPAIARIADGLSGPLHLIDVGASAGLNLALDAYRYRYGDQLEAGPAGGRPELACQLKGAVPDLPGLPPIGHRIGIDPAPLSLSDPDDMAWLQALIWPEQEDRRRNLTQAIATARGTDIRMLTGDALNLLPQAFQVLPDSGTVCLMHTFTLNQFTAVDRKRFEALCRELGAARPFDRLALEWGEGHAPQLIHHHYGPGEPSACELAFCEPHGAWLDWRG